jgi:hypothetical protein
MHELQQIRVSGGKCAVIEAAYDDVATVMLRILTFCKLASKSTCAEFEFPSEWARLERRESGADATSTHIDQMIPFETASPSPNDIPSEAILRKAAGLHLLHNASFTGHLDGIRKDLAFFAQNDVDTTLTVLNQLPLQWMTQDPSTEMLYNLKDMYLEVLAVSGSSEVRSIAVRDLAAVMEQLTVLNPISAALPFNNYGTACVSFLLRGGPDLSNAELQITGILLLHESFSLSEKGSMQAFNQHMNAWGTMLSDAGRAENVRFLTQQ